MKEHRYPNPVHCVLRCDPDHVPVCDQPHEAGIPRGEQQTAPSSTLPERKAGQEEHGAMRCIFCQPQLGLFFTGSTQKCVSVYIVSIIASFCISLMFTTVNVCYFITKDQKKHAVTLNKALYF